MFLRRVLACCLISTACSTSLLGQETELLFHPRSRLSLGAGFDIDAPDHMYRRAIDRASKNKLDVGPISSECTATLVTNHEELATALNIDSHFQARCLSAKGFAKFSFLKSVNFGADSISVVLTGKITGPRWELIPSNESPLIADAKTLIDSGNFAEFRKRYGTHFVAVEHTGAQISFLLSISNVAQGSVNQIRSEVGGKAGFLVTALSTKTSLAREVAAAFASGRVDINYFTIGDVNAASLEEALRAALATPSKPEEAAKFVSAMSKCLKTATCASTAFNLMSYKGYGVPPTEHRPIDEHRNRTLRRLADKYREVEAKIETIESILDGRDPRNVLIREATDPETRKQELRSAGEICEKCLKRIADLHAMP